MSLAPANLRGTDKLNRQEWVACRGMVRVGEHGAAYILPHLLNRDAGGRSFEDVLIIGAGSGNDAQAALSHGARLVGRV